MARARGVAARGAVPAHPRRVSGPVSRPVPVPGRPRPSTPVDVPHPTFGATLRALPDHRLLDKLLRSRAWIWLLGAALGGVVFMQVSLLGMNSGIGASVTAATELEHANAVLGQEVAELSSGPRIEAAATGMGLIWPDAGDVGFVDARGSIDARRAASTMTPPAEQAPAPVEPVATAEPVVTIAPTVEPVVTTAPTVEPVATAAPPTEYDAVSGAAAAP